MSKQAYLRKRDRLQKILERHPSMYRYAFIFISMAFMAFNGCRPPWPQFKPVTHGIMVLDGGNRRVNSLEVGSSLHVSARGLEPNQLYEFRLGINSEEIASLDQAVSFARMSTDRYGNIPPFILQYHSGVVGCSPRIKDANLPNYMYRSFDEAEENLRGANMNVSIHPVQSDTTGRIAPMELEVGAAVSKIQLPIVARQNPMLFPSDSTGCLLNSAAVQERDMYVSGRNFKPGEVVQLSIVPNQRSWYVNDPINDITGVGGTSALVRIKAGQDGRFTVRVWDHDLQRRGVYDIVAQRLMDQSEFPRIVGSNDVISYGSDTGYILFMRYPVGGPTMDIAGRPISGPPYFQFSDSFAETDDAVWGAVDPTYVPDGHLGGRYAAYYVVDHRDVGGWDPTTGGSTNLVDVSAGGNIEIMPVKSGCINMTDVVIWEPPLSLGNYDVVVDFGISPAETETDYATDSQYNVNYDFLDGADQIGFVVAKDPYEVAQAPYVPGKTYPIGQAEYSQDNYFSALGGATDVDLRAIVRYPATANGIDTPVAAGQHPLFIIEHGNHFTCEIALDGRPYYDVVQEYRDGLISWPEFLASLHSYDSCTQRTPNHQGYMGLLDILASHGIIAVSIDAYDLTGCTSSGCAPQYPIERGTLILKHIQLWSHMNDPATYNSYPDFFGGNISNHVDMSKISVSGHSRGGEASVKAYLINSSNPTEYGFSIGSVSSIAPMDVSYNVLPDVPYFVIIPAADGDVSSLYGVRIYDNAGSTETPVDLTTKSGIDVYGANHNFFNTVWADDGDDSWTPRDDYILKADQQRIGEAYLAAFTRIHLNNEHVYEDMLRGQLIFPSTAGFKIYHFRHEKSHSKVEDGDGAHVTIPAAPATAVTTSSILGPSVHDSQALQVNWLQYTDQLVYTVPVGQRDASAFEVLSFRVAQTNSADNPISLAGQDFQVEIIGGGKDKSVWASYFGQIPPPYDRGSFDHNVMTTVRIPLHSFIMNKSGVKLEDIGTIKFKFSNPAKGDIYVDDIEFSR